VDPLIGREIGSYRLTARIAAGGMGVVYRAERSDGLFRRDVAIKLIRIELATESLLRRFEFERRTLAALHHPNIAQLSDGGATADGRPYLVMEFVQGIPIDRYCDEHRLSTGARARLFVQVCRAVHYAHQNLVVHRDLKPANILIDENGSPKLLDFGIARLIDESAQEQGAGMTLTGGQLLTPDYASPEQLTMGRVTTSMDVYSLGVVLYELFTGRRPIPSENLTPLEWHRAVLEHPPTRPSSTALWSHAAVSPQPIAPAGPDELAARRGTTPRSLRRQLGGDLDRVVLMALRKEPERRYASAKDLADDIERHFSGHPVLARRDSFAYRATKFVQRNRLAVGSAVALLIALGWGYIAASRGEKRAQAQEQHARIEATSFQRISEFLMDTFLSSAPSMEPREVGLKRERIQMHAARIRREFDGQGHLRANLLDSLGRVAERLGAFDDAGALLNEAKAIREKEFGRESLEYALSLQSEGRLHFARGEPGPAAELMARALELHRTRSHETHTDVATVANDLAACLRGLGRLDEAFALHREALELRRRDGPSLAVAESLNNIAGIYMDRGELPLAAQHLEEAYAIRRRILGEDDPLTLQSMSNLATILWRTEARDRAHALLDEVEAGYRSLHADGEEPLAHVLSNRGAMLVAEKKYAEAERFLNEALELQKTRLGEKHPVVATTLGRIAQMQEALDRPDEARVTWDRMLAIRREPDASPRSLGQALYDYGMFLWETKARDEAREAVRESIEVLKSAGAARTPQLARAELFYGEMLIASGDAAAARPHVDSAMATFAAAPEVHKADLERAEKALKRLDGEVDR